MNMNDRDLRLSIVRPTLAELECESPASAEQLLMAVAGGAAGSGSLDGLGVFRITAGTHRRIWDEYLAFRPDLASKVRGLASQHAFLADPHMELIANLRYATAIAWILYVVHPGELDLAESVA